MTDHIPHGRPGCIVECKCGACVAYFRTCSADELRSAIRARQQRQNRLFDRQYAIEKTRSANRHNAQLQAQSISKRLTDWGFLQACDCDNGIDRLANDYRLCPGCGGAGVKITDEGQELLGLLKEFL